MLEDSKLTWRRFCEPPHACVEVAKDGDVIRLRDSKDRQAGTLTFTEAELTAFAKGWLNQGL